MIFVDTSAIYAALDRDDQNHTRAAVIWAKLLDEGTPLITTSYVVVEGCALAQHRLGMNAVRAIHHDLLPVIEVMWVSEKIHRLAMAAALGERTAEIEPCGLRKLRGDAGVGG